jgi:uncharacterized coiled-coil protein SlyX
VGKTRREKSSAKAKIKKGNHTMRNRTMTAMLATGLCVFVSFAPSLLATRGAENDPPDADSPAFRNLPGMRDQAVGKKAPAAPATALFGFNTADGDHALFNITTGVANTAIGWYSLFSNTDGSFNTGVGAGALALNLGDQTTGEGTQNTAVGTAALLFNSTGQENTGVGTTALQNNTAGNDNTAFGSSALQSNDIGSGNTAVGHQALLSNIDSNSNTVVGRVALTNHTTGSFNTAIGNQALQADTTGTRNTAVGSVALGANLTGNDNTAVGRHAGDVITGNGNVCIGEGVAGESAVDNSTYIRNVNTTEQTPDDDVAFVTVRLSDSRLGHQPVLMRSSSSDLQKTVGELKSKMARQERIIAQQQKTMEALMAQVREVSAQLRVNKSAPQLITNAE